ncbi:fimbrial protein [Pantoea ananatis]|uniref:fimbrial protein n=1 Tax=Pantoea ananas TaxID=553 RepID=UPI0024ACB715|nr:fimbrial protein [Pantoea ananatis]MDI6539107.1 fimbrial protein [Pantoea ananatis]
MKKIIALSALMSALSLAGLSAQAATVIVSNSGTVKFTGQIVNAACAVNVNSTSQIVKMGQAKTSTLNQAGNVSNLVPFSIQLDNCDSTVSSKVQFAFTGNAVSASNLNVLQVDGSAAGSATNVGVQILDSAGTALNFAGTNGPSWSTATNLANGTNIIPFEARYYATGVSTPGQADASATFAVQYN